MKTKLLKIIRKDKRYSIEHRMRVTGFPYSGWWYLVDDKLQKRARNKRLKELLKLYLFFLTSKRKIMMYKIICLLCAIFMIIAISSCVENEPAIEIWNPYTNSSDSISESEQIMLIQLGLQDQSKSDTIK